MKDSQSNKVILLDDHPLVHDGVRQLLNTSPRFDLDCCVSSLEELRLALGEPFAALLLDLNIKGVNSLEWLERIRLWQPKLKVIAFSSYNTTAIVRKALQAGVDGYLLKDVSATELEEALQAVVSGKRFVCERVNGRWDTSRSDSNTFFEDEFVLEARLTGREREVMLAIVEGLDSKSIAKRLYISLHTVQSHRKRLFKKLGVHSAAELIRFVHRKPED